MAVEKTTESGELSRTKLAIPRIQTDVTRAELKWRG